MFNSEVLINGSSIKIISGDKNFELNKSEIESVETFYEKLPSSIWKHVNISPLVIKMKLSNNETLSFYELTGFLAIKNWIEGGTYE